MKTLQTRIESSDTPPIGEMWRLAGYLTREFVTARGRGDDVTAGAYLALLKALADNRITKLRTR